MSAVNFTIPVWRRAGPAASNTTWTLAYMVTFRPGGAVVEASGERHCVLTSGSDSLDSIALHLALLDIPFTPLDPPGLRDRCAVLAGRLRQAASRYPPEEHAAHHQPPEEHAAHHSPTQEEADD